MSDDVITPEDSETGDGSEQTSAASVETLGSTRPEGREAESEGASPVSEDLLKWEKAVLKALGKEVIESDHNFGDFVVRVTPAGYKKAAKIAREKLGCDYLSFIAGIDWMPMPIEGAEGEGDPSQPAQPREMTFGIAGSDSRFQVFAHVQSTEKHLGLTIKVDVDESAMSVASWTNTYPGADWHERECWEMYGIDFVGHPEIRHLYLPGEFEGYPLRKDFPLLARVIKPWPGLVDVEPMPGDDSADEEGGDE